MTQIRTEARTFMKNSILLITYHFLPDSNGGVGRSSSLYRYLPLYGINPIILTHNDYGKRKDDHNIIRCGSLSNWRSNGIISKKVFLKIISKILNTLGLFIQSDFVWQRNVMKVADTIISKYKIEALYSTYPEIDALMLGLLLSEKHNLPLLTEFRDGLVFEPLCKYNRIQKGRIERIEKSIIDSSKAVVTIGSNLSQYFHERYHMDRVFTVYNGYDPHDFEGLDGIRRQKTDKTRIAYFGGFSKSRPTNIRPFLKAIKRLKDDELIKGNTFEISLIGNYTRGEHRLVQGSNVGDIIKFYPPMNKQEGFRKLVSEYDFLLFHGVRGKQTIISSKLLEYINLGKPIIGICKGNEAEEIIARTGTGEVCDFDVDSIYTLFVKFIEGRYRYNPNELEIEKYDRRVQTSQIADIINDNLVN